PATCRIYTLSLHDALPISDLEEARQFAEAIHAEYPGKMLAYNCSPSFNWKRYLDDDTIARFQRELAAMGYKFQFITLAGFHALKDRKSTRLNSSHVKISYA